MCDLGIVSKPGELLNRFKKIYRNQVVESNEDNCQETQIMRGILQAVIMAYSDMLSAARKPSLVTMWMIKIS